MNELTTNDVVARHLATASGALETAVILLPRLSAIDGHRPKIKREDVLESLQVARAYLHIAAEYAYQLKGWE